MTEKDSHGGEVVFTNPPPSIDQLKPTSASQQLYNVYAGRIEEFPSYRQRPFSDAQEDFEATIHAAQEGQIENIVPIIHRVISPESYSSFTSDLAGYWKQHGLEQDLGKYSYCFLTNHHFFSDLTIAATGVLDNRRADPNAANRNAIVTGRMIPGMEVDIDGHGNYAPITPLIKLIARQVQTVPGLPDHATKEMQAQANVWNQEAKKILDTLVSMPGNILYVAGSGTHDTEHGGSLIMKKMRESTARLLCSPSLKIIPLFFSCKSLGPNGLEPAEAKHNLLRPRVLNSSDEAHEAMVEIAQAGSEALDHDFPKGVHYGSTLPQSARRAGEEIVRKFRHSR